MELPLPRLDKLLVLPGVHPVHFRIDICGKVVLFPLDFLGGRLILISSEIVFFVLGCIIFYFLGGGLSQFELGLGLLFGLDSGLVCLVGETWVKMGGTDFVHAELSCLLGAGPVVFEGFILTSPQGLPLFVGKL